MTNAIKQNEKVASNDTTYSKACINDNINASKTQAKSADQRKINTILDAPGLVGEIASYINETSFKTQPILAIPAAIVATGAIYGHRLRTRTDLRTNIYALSRAESGAGKDAPQKAVSKLFAELPDNMGDVVCGDPASASGMLYALNRTGGIGLFLIDEIGHFLFGVRGNNTNNHLREIMPLWTKLFTSANSKYRALEYSRRVKDTQPMTDIDQPCVCILGSSVPSRIDTAIGLDDICDGFLPRWLAFESFEIAPPNNPQLKTFEESSAQVLLTHINNLTAKIPAKSAPTIAEIDEDARQILQDFQTKAEDLRIKAINNESNMKYIYSRSYEHAEKLALIGCEFINDTPTITKRSAQWAVAVVEYSNDIMHNMIKNIATTRHEQDLDDMLTIIKRYCANNGKLPKTEFCNICRKWDKKRRDSLLQDLIDSGQILSSKNDNITYIKPA